ncbi:ABC transporter permease [Silvimonas amylolytica]|uniref:Glycoprotein endopeptidase metalloprotease n=1 Tax=Silvimonas amylolytica TaxID=449663 RepID=A0ABQ2PID8_9NEIS|nr:ABC transporter permease [Silvimonas amylolytica]GGP25247.1 glycoprotein endopeptidase metalloprotease [Silvimonas amylolytica]
MAHTEPPITAIADLRQDTQGEHLYLAGRLDASGTAAIWDKARQLARHDLRVEAAAVDYCDGAGLALIYALIQQGAQVENLPQRYGALLNELNPAQPLQTAPPEKRPAFLIRLGARAAAIWSSFYDLMSFTGELTAAWGVWLRKPGIMRWGDMLEQCIKAGVNATPIVLLVAFLFGVILAFQSAVPMRQFGAELFVANLVGLSLVRELAPLMTAVLLAGRTGAAFAAEIGTMKVNEEINALITLGLEPVRFLVLPRILAVTLMAPMLTVLAEVIGILGAGLVLLTFNIPLQTTVAQVMDSVGFADYIGGLAKATVYGFGIAVIGCRRGLNTGAGASAVGASTTQAVVSSIVMLVVADGLFAVAFYYLGW